MKAKRRWRRANELRDASELRDVVDRDLALIRFGLKGWYYDNPYFTDETMEVAASLVLDGMPSTPKRPRAAGKGGRG